MSELVIREPVPILPDVGISARIIGTPTDGGEVATLAEEVTVSFPLQQIIDLFTEVCATPITVPLDLSGTFEAHVDIDGDLVLLRIGPAVTMRSDTLDPVHPPPQVRSVLIMTVTVPGSKAQLLASEFARLLKFHTLCYSDAEISAIWSAMPMLSRFATPDPLLGQWAVIFRDHFVENSVGFLIAMERCGVSREWIYALAKGDCTAHRARIDAWLRYRGFRNGTLDNAVIDGKASDNDIRLAREIATDVDEFIRSAHATGRRVLAIDDGGLVAQHRTPAARLLSEQIDAALELTVSGLKRIAYGVPVPVPVLNLAKSELKSLVAYNEIADSCLRRMRDIVPGEKFIGRRVLVVGFGTLGSRIAWGLRTQGCRVTVVDTDILKSIQAAEQGFNTYRTVLAALRRENPFLMTSATGEGILGPEELAALPDGLLLAGFATKDFSLLSEGRGDTEMTEEPCSGRRYRFPDGRSVFMLGDGRSLNLFEYEGIPNRGYDAYRAGTIIAMKYLCRHVDNLGPGVHTKPVNDAIRQAKLFEAYYDLYFDEQPSAAT